MALDNAQFISELSIIDPPGSDPLSQGDDQIRTAKRTQFQSFPFIDKQVNLTADQMNLAAIKNEQNVFTAGQTIQNSDLILNAAVDGNESVRYALAGVDTWALSMRDASQGNDFQLRRFDAGGTLLDIPWLCDLQTGVIDFTHVPTIDKAPLWIAGEIRQFVAAVTPGANWFIADGTNGTVNLEDRWLVGAGAFAGAPGTNLNANLDATTATGVTGSTAISEAQMPSHGHGLRGGSQTGVTDVQVGFASNETVVGANRGNSGGSYFTNNSSGNRYINVNGSGAGHTHADGGNAVNVQNPTFTQSVQPVSVAVQTWQYVP